MTLVNRVPLSPEYRGSWYFIDELEIVTGQISDQKYRTSVFITGIAKDRLPRDAWEAGYEFHSNETEARERHDKIIRELNSGRYELIEFLGRPNLVEFEKPLV